MIETKFRAYSLEDKIMYDIAFPTWNGSIEVWWHNKPQTWTITYSQNGPDDEAVLMQYTGLKDKNGKEIYEGDILRAGILGVVTFNRGRFVGTYISSSSNPEGWGYAEQWEDEIYQHRDIEVLGNIYENEDLL